VHRFAWGCGTRLRMHIGLLSVAAVGLPVPSGRQVADRQPAGCPSADPMPPLSVQCLVRSKAQTMPRHRRIGAFGIPWIPKVCVRLALAPVKRGMASCRSWCCGSPHCERYTLTASAFPAARRKETDSLRACDGIGWVCMCAQSARRRWGCVRASVRACVCFCGCTRACLRVV
jgi:hypothetical protein